MKANTSQPHGVNPAIVSLMIPILLICITPIILFEYLSVFQLAGSALMLSICIGSLIVGHVKEVGKSDINMIWVLGIVYNLYLFGATYLYM